MEDYILTMITIKFIIKNLNINPFIEKVYKILALFITEVFKFRI